MTGDASKSAGRDLSGFLLVDKPFGLTSHDVVAKVRRLSCQKSVGHTGTLDPMATGLMVVLLGRATKLEPYVVSLSKIYEGTAELGHKTDSDDVTGQTLNRHHGPWPQAEEVSAALKEFIGPLAQRPPAFSAIKVAGRPAYKAARQGDLLDLPPRAVTAFDLKLTAYNPPNADFTAEVSAGFYIRSLARDLGERLGLGGGALSRLRRLKVGDFDISQAVTMTELAGWAPEDWAANLRPLPEAVSHLPRLDLAPEQTHRLNQGQFVSLDGNYQPGTVFLATGKEDSFLALAKIIFKAPEDGAEPQGPFLRPLRVLYSPNQA